MTVRFAPSLEPLLVPLSSVRQHPTNPNNGDIDELIASIKVSGFVTAITVDEETGYILAGNHRYQALHALGATEIPVIYARFDPDKGAERFMVGDNQIARLAVMDNDMLLEHLKDLQATEIGLIASGFDDDRFMRLMEEAAAGAALPQEPAMGQGAYGIFQVVVDFDNASDRDELLADLTDRFEDKARGVNL